MLETNTWWVGGYTIQQRPSTAISISISNGIQIHVFVIALMLKMAVTAISICCAEAGSHAKGHHQANLILVSGQFGRRVSKAGFQCTQKQTPLLWPYQLPTLEPKTLSWTTEPGHNVVAGT